MVEGIDIRIKTEVPIASSEHGMDVKKPLTFGAALERFLFTGVGGSESDGKGGDCGVGINIGDAAGCEWGMSPRPRRKAAEVGEAKRRCLEVGSVDGKQVVRKGVVRSGFVDSFRKTSTGIVNLPRRKTKTASRTTSTIITTSTKVTKPTSGNSGAAKSSEPRTLRSPFSTKIPEHHLEPLLAHPAPLLDILDPSLLLIFIGTNPGLLTAYTGHTYSSPTNSFWKLLHASKLTLTENGLPLQATEDRTLPKRFLLGNTNIVERASRSQEDLSREEMVLGAGRAVKKIGRWRPEGVCVVGKGVWEAFVGWGRKMRLERGKSGFSGAPVAGRGFSWGWQVDKEGRELRMGVGDGGNSESESKVEEEEGGFPERSWLVKSERTVPPPPKYEGPWEGARVYVVPSTSGLVTMPFTKKLEIWEGVGEWVGKRREERGFTCS